MAKKKPTQKKPIKKAYEPPKPPTIVTRRVKDPHTGELISKEKASDELIQSFFKVLNLMVNEAIGIRQAIIRIDGIDLFSFFNVIYSGSYYAEQYQRANELRAELINEKMIERIEDDTTDYYINDKGVKIPNAVRVQRDRLIYDATKFQLERMNPKKFLNNSSTNIQVNIGAPLSPDEVNNILKELD